jgi:hypothetical protein
MTRIVTSGLAVALVAGAVVAAVFGAAPGSAPAGVAVAVPAAAAGAPTVLLSSDAALHPVAGGVAPQLQRYFDAINAGDYAGWAATVATGRADVLPEKSWKAAYRSTKDGTIRVDRIDDLPGDTVLVRVRFISTQDVADAPPDLRVTRICWRSTMPMAGSPPRIGTTQGGSSVKEAC